MLGTIQDLSGPLAGFGKQVRMGMLLRIDEAQRTGRHPRPQDQAARRRLGYDPKKAVLAAQKLVNQDKIFAMVGHLGTAQNMAAMPVQFEKNVINFFPVTAAREMYEPFHQLKYSLRRHLLRPDAHRALPKLVKEKNAKKVCTMYQDDDFGLEVHARRRSRPEDHRHGAGREDQLQARRHRLLVAGRQDEIVRLRPGGAGHHHPRDHRHHGRGKKTGFNPSSSVPAPPTPT